MRERVNIAAFPQREPRQWCKCIERNISIWVRNKLKLASLLVFCRLCCSKWRIFANLVDLGGFAVTMATVARFPDPGLRRLRNKPTGSRPISARMRRRLHSHWKTSVLLLSGVGFLHKLQSLPVWVKQNDDLLTWETNSFWVLPANQFFAVCPIPNSVMVSCEVDRPYLRAPFRR